jgi:uncharacterized protein YutE (UPF0331/DUF86 family)
MSTPERDDPWTLTVERLGERHPGLPAEAVRQRLRRLEEIVAVLEEMGPEAPRAGVLHAWAAERGLQLAIENAFDAGRQVLGGLAGGGGERFREVLDGLTREGILAADLRAGLADLAGWRDLLLAPAPLPDPTPLSAALERAPRDFSDFARALRVWLALEMLPAEDEPEPEAPPGAPEPVAEGPGGSGGASEP